MPENINSQDHTVIQQMIGFGIQFIELKMQQLSSERGLDFPNGNLKHETSGCCATGALRNEAPCQARPDRFLLLIFRTPLRKAALSLSCLVLMRGVEPPTY